MLDLPTKVREEAEEADKLLKEIVEGKTEEVKTPEPEPQTDDKAGVEGDKSPDEKSLESEAKPEEKKEAEEVKEEKPQPQDIDYKAEYEKMKQKFSVLTGKYNAEVPRLYDQIDALKKEIETLKAAPKKADEKEVKTNEYLVKLSEEYGEDFVENLVKGLEKKFRSESFAESKPLEERVDQSKVKDNEAERTKFFTDLTMIIPEWQEVVRDPEFTNYLTGIDPATGIQRYILAQNADRGNDAIGVSTFYRDFIKSRPIPEKEEIKPPQKDKESLLTPKSSPRSVLVEDKDKPIFSRRDVDEFYKQLQTGTFRGAREERDKLLKTYELAALEGRIIDR